MIGYIGAKPILKDVKFKINGKMNLVFEDGRELIIPLKDFPEIKKLSITERNKFFISDGVYLFFEKSNEVYHIEQFLGSFRNYMHV